MKGQYMNPLGIQGIGDPFILKASDNTYYCYATSWNNGFFVWKSADLVNLEKIGPASSKNSTSWGKSDFWAPEVTFYENKYYMFYSVRWYKNGSLRVGLAVSDNPKGPFLDYTEGPLFDHGTAAIDAHLFSDEGGSNYLYYSLDCSENIVDGRHESHVYGVEISRDLRTLIGTPVLLTKPDQEWEFKSGNEWRWNEGPSILKHNNQYYMTYSANFYASGIIRQDMPHPIHHCVPLINTAKIPFYLPVKISLRYPVPDTTVFLLLLMEVKYLQLITLIPILKKEEEIDSWPLILFDLPLEVSS